MDTLITAPNYKPVFVTRINEANPMILEPSSQILTSQGTPSSNILGKVNVTTLERPSAQTGGLIVDNKDIQFQEEPNKTCAVFKDVDKNVELILGKTKVSSTSTEAERLTWKGTKTPVTFTKTTEELVDEATEGEFVYTSDKGDLYLNGHVYKADLEVPTKTSELENDAEFATIDEVPTKTSELENDAEFATVDSVPTKTSELENDSGFITESEVPQQTFESGVSAITLGGLSSGTDVSGKSAIDVLDMILFPEYAPKWTDATASLSGGCTLEVGQDMPGESNFTASGSTASAGSVTGGSATDTITIPNTTTNTRKQVTVSLSRVYAEGSAQVVTSKGNPTNKTASNTTTLLQNASVNSNIDATTFKIKSITKTATQTVSFAWPIYIDNVKQTLGYSTTSYEKTKQVIDGGNITFSCPTSYTSKSVYYYDSVNRVWVDITSQCSSVSADKNINGVTKAYTTYTFAKTAGSRPYRLSFVIA